MVWKKNLELEKPLDISAWATHRQCSGTRRDTYHPVDHTMAAPNPLHAEASYTWQVSCAALFAAPTSLLVTVISRRRSQSCSGSASFLVMDSTCDLSGSMAIPVAYSGAEERDLSAIYRRQAPWNRVPSLRIGFRPDSRPALDNKH